MKRLFDITFASLLFSVFSGVFVLLGLIVFYTSKGPILHWSRRNGQNNMSFLMPKFRTMQINAPDVATHLLEHPQKWLTPVGSFLRRTSLDELPQLWSILRGDMSFVGPRPALFNQHDLIELRTSYNVHLLKPGLTGWAQINGRDKISIKEKVFFDREYMAKQSFLFDLNIIMKTIFSFGGDKNVSH